MSYVLQVPLHPPLRQPLQAGARQRSAQVGAVEVPELQVLGKRPPRPPHPLRGQAQGGAAASGFPDRGLSQAAPEAGTEII